MKTRVWIGLLEGVLAATMATVPLLAGRALAASVPGCGRGPGSEAGTAPSAGEMDAFVSRVIANQEADRRALADYERMERWWPAAAPDEVSLERVIPVAGENHRIRLRKRGTAVSPGVYREELASVVRKLERIASRGVTPLVEAERLGRTLVSELPRAFVFTWLGVEERGGRKLAVIALDPNPAYNGRGREASVLRSVKATAWVDLATERLALGELLVTRDISIGFGILGKVYAGGRCRLEQGPMADGRWLPSRFELVLNGRRLVFGFEKETVRELASYRRLGDPAQAAARLRQELAGAATAAMPALAASRRAGTPAGSAPRDRSRAAQPAAFGPIAAEVAPR